MNAKSPIQTLAERLMQVSGVDYPLAWHSLKTHLNSLTMEEFIEQIGRVDNPDIFSTLWSMGLGFSQQKIAMLRWEELVK